MKTIETRNDWSPRIQSNIRLMIKFQSSILYKTIVRVWKKDQVVACTKPANDGFLHSYRGPQNNMEYILIYHEDDVWKFKYFGFP